MKAVVAVVVLLGLGAIAQADPLAVEIAPAGTSWQIDGNPVDVALRVVNTSPAKQTLRAMSCSWDEHWQSSDAELEWARWDCTRNAARTIELEPGKAYETKLRMTPTRTAKLGAHPLRMGFTPIGGTLRWSNTVTITVTR